MFALCSPWHYICLMASVEIYIPKDRNYKSGKSPIYLQFIVSRRKFKKQICFIEPDFLDRNKASVKAKHPESVRINRLIHKKLSEAKAYLLDCEFNEEPVSPRDFFRYYTGGASIIDHLEARESSLKDQGSISRANTFKYIRQKIVSSGLSPQLSGINETWVESFNLYLIRSNIGPGTRGLYLSGLNALFKRLINQGYVKSNPLLDFKIPKGHGTKEKYSLEEFNIIRSLELTGKVHFARQMFVFATMARGMRAFDALTLKSSNIEAGRLKYTSQKSKKEFNIEMNPMMTACLEGLPDNGEYVFPFVKMKSSMMKTNKEKYLRHVGAKNNSVNQTYLAKVEKLSGISKHLTFHVARNTFSNIWLQSGSDLRVLQELLGHSDLKATMAYANEIKQGEALDKAAKSMF